MGLTLRTVATHSHNWAGYAGWPSAIGTLWSISDRVAAEVSADLWKRPADGGRTRPEIAAESLHHAVRAARRRRPRHPSAWATPIHAGF